VGLRARAPGTGPSQARRHRDHQDHDDDDAPSLVCGAAARVSLCARAEGARGQAETAQAEGVGRGQGAGQTAGPAEDRGGPSVALCTCRQLPSENTDFFAPPSV